jgi:uncharacterized protein YggE
MNEDAQTIKADLFRPLVLPPSVADGRAGGNALAEALGVKVVCMLSVVEGSASVQPMREVMLMERAADAAAPTQVMPSLIEVRGQVTLTVEIGQC